MVKNLLHRLSSQLRRARTNPRMLPFAVGVLVVLLALYLVPVVIFVELADEVMEGDLYFDTLAMNWVQTWHSSSATGFFKVITEMGGIFGVGALAVGATLSYWSRGRAKAGLMVAASVGGAAIINVVLKSIFQRDRPDFWEHLVQEAGYSFPSGHAMGSAALAIALMFLLWRTRARWWALGIGASYMILVGLSRMYLGVHYPTDILAGWCVSFLWVSIVAFTLYEYSVFKQLKKR